MRVGVRREKSKKSKESGVLVMLALLFAPSERVRVCLRENEKRERGVRSDVRSIGGI